MGKSADYIIHDRPNWMFEVAACITEQSFEREEEIIENHSKFGMDRDKAWEFFEKYASYKKSVSTEIMLILREYPLLEGLFQRRKIIYEGSGSIGLSLVMFLGEELSEEMKPSLIDDRISEFIVEYIEDLVFDSKVDSIEIKDLISLIDFLDHMKIDDSLKIQFIYLYRNRYEIISQLNEMLSMCEPICVKYYPIVKDEFEKAVENLRKADHIKMLLDSSVKMKTSKAFKGEIIPTIFCFNQLSMRFYENRVLYHIGIYFFFLMDLQDKNKFNDTQIIADLKALGDASRLKIVKLISKKKMYAQELADELDLTSATISHHINILLKSELISITIDPEKERKIYYEPNYKKIESLGEIIKSMAKTHDDGGSIDEEKSQLSIW